MRSSGTIRVCFAPPGFSPHSLVLMSVSFASARAVVGLFHLLRGIVITYSVDYQYIYARPICIHDSLQWP